MLRLNNKGRKAVKKLGLVTAIIVGLCFAGTIKTKSFGANNNKNKNSKAECEIIQTPDWLVNSMIKQQNGELAVKVLKDNGFGENEELAYKLANIVTRESYEYKKFITENPNAWQTQDDSDKDWNYEDNIPFLAYRQGTVDCEMPKQVFEKKLDVKLLNMIEAERKKGKSLL